MFIPSNRSRRQPPGPLGFRQNTGQPQASNANVKPDFLRQTGRAQPGQSTTSQVPGFEAMSPQDQRAALFEQARQQVSGESRTNFQHMRDMSTALPGGLTEKQRTDFKMLQRTNPAAAEQQLINYQRNADARYNKPSVSPQKPSGTVNRRPPSNFSGPRPRF